VSAYELLVTGGDEDAPPRRHRPLRCDIAIKDERIAAIVAPRSGRPDARISRRLNC
jgi:hypothetical protein